MGAVSSIVAVDATTGVARRLLSRLNVREAVWAALSSIAAGVVDFGVLIALVQHGVGVAVSAFIAAACGAVVNFACSKYLAFCDRSPLTLRQALRFAGVSLGGAVLIALTMQVSAVGLGVPYVLAKLLCSTLVFAAWTYPAQRYLVFRNPGSERALRRAEVPRLAVLTSSAGELAA
jgi:putative flippase GtrA